MRAFFRWNLNLSGLVSAAGALVCLFTVPGFLGQFGWLCEITSHFRVQCSVCLCTAAALLCVARRFKTAAVFLRFTLPNVIVVLPVYFGERSELPTGGERLKVALIT